jgi:hypothetical protein
LGGVLFCELGPPGTDQAIGIFGRHLDDAVLSDGDMPAGEGLDRADPLRRLEADIDRLRIASATIATGFTVGCNAKRLPSAPAREKELAPGYCLREDRAV